MWAFSCGLPRALLRLKLCSCLYSSRCRRDHTRQAPHRQPTRAHTIQLAPFKDAPLCLSLSLPPIFEPCLYSSRPRPCSCESWTKFFLPHPPSLTQPTRPAVPRPVSYQLPALTAWSDGFTSYSADRLRRRSPIQPALYALPDRTSYTVCCCLSVCQSRTALIS